jgi:hypothetical protein
MLRQRCAHIDRGRLMPVHQSLPFGGVRLKAISAAMLPVVGGVASPHALLVEEGEEG